ncbi:MAG TPA: hypothetical protein VI383_11595 [Gemmatimonadales bacterium]|nr:hypothetical protein [Gemmatimonadales bacterium]
MAKKAKARKPSWEHAGPHRGTLRAKMGNPSADDVRRGPARARVRGKVEAAWAADMERWGRRVRRDIILLEAHIRQIWPAAQLYNDPGDPPPPPKR